MNAARTIAPTVSSTIAKQFHMDRQGKDFILYAGLLDKATDVGLISLQARLVQAPNEQNGHTAICEATAVFPEGRTFTDIGDASPANVGKMIAMHIIRMASTRAKARALRDGLNIGGAAYEELGPEEDEPVQRTAPARADSPRPLRPAQPETPSGDTPTKAHLDRLAILSAIVAAFLDRPTNLHPKTAAKASEFIAGLVKGIATSDLPEGTGTLPCSTIHMAAMRNLVAILDTQPRAYLEELMVRGWEPTLAEAWDVVRSCIQGEVAGS